MKIQKDIFGIQPEIGDIIIFNPPRYKGLVYGRCIGFMASGLPKVNWNDNELDYRVPKTGFVVKKN